MSTAATITSFENWMRSMGISWADDAIHLVDAAAGGTLACGGLALGAVAARDLSPGDELCTIPKPACITLRTSSIADVLDAEQLGGGLGLTLAVLHEAALGEASKWYGYFQAMPGREYLPIFWGEEEMARLKGTDIEGAAAADRANIAEDFESHVAPLVTLYPDRFTPEAMTLEAFSAAASLVASRAFGVDPVHGDGMVPLADIFNHKVSVVDLAPGYAVHGHDSSSDDEGDSEGAEGSQEEGDSDGEPSADGESDSSSGSEGGDGDSLHGGEEHEQHRNGGSGFGSVMRAGDEPPSLYGITSANGLHLGLHIAIVDCDDHLQIVAASAVPQGHEVFNTYGELGNAELVKKYGFALRDNPFTVVTLNKRSVVNACATQIEAADQKSTSTGQPSKRAKRGKEGASSGAAPGDGLLGLLETETSLLDEDEEPFEVMANGHMGPALFITLRMLCSGADGGAAFTCVEDALRLPAPEDSSDAEAAPLFIDPEDIGAVPVRLMTSQNDAAAAAVADAEGINGKGVGSGAQSHPCSGMISPAMCRALHQAVTMRLAGYPTSLAETCEELREFEKRVATGRAGALGEGEAAVRAALVLRASEQGVLEDMLAALESRRGQK